MNNDDRGDALTFSIWGFQVEARGRYAVARTLVLVAGVLGGVGLVQLLL